MPELRRLQTKPASRYVAWPPGFLPTLEKFSKSSTLLVSPDEVMFIQKAVDADGMHISLRVPQVRTRRAPLSGKSVLWHAPRTGQRVTSSSKQAHC